MARLSVIIPVYNCNNRLHLCVESIIRQSFADWELILVNDGSMDDSFEVCQDYANKDNRIIAINQKNLGAGPARNKGIEVAKGEYIVFCDADDFYSKDAFMRLDNAINEYAFDLIIGGYNEFKIDSDNKIHFGFKRILENWSADDFTTVKHKYMELRKQGCITAPWAKAYRRSLLKDYCIQFPDLRRCQDIAFNLDVYDRIRSLCIIDAVLYNYQTPDGDTYLSKFPVNMFDIHKFIYSKTIDMLKKWDCCDCETKSALNALFLKDCSILLRLNYKNQWKLNKQRQSELAMQIMNDKITMAACETNPRGLKNKMIRLVLKKQKKWLSDFFSWGTLIWMKICKK